MENRKSVGQPGNSGLHGK